MACPASPPHYQRDPIATLKTAFLGDPPLHSLCDNQLFWGFSVFLFLFRVLQACSISWSSLASATHCFCRRQPARLGILHWHFTSASSALPLSWLRRLTLRRAQVYGDPHVHPQPETYWGHVSCTGIRACYDEGKRVGETLCFEFNRKYGTRVRVIRIFNTYGPNMCVALR